MRIFITKNKIIRFTGVILFWLCVWQVLYLFVEKEILLVSPFQVAKTFLIMLTRAEVWMIAFHSCMRVLSGFFLAMSLGVLSAILCWKSKFFHELLYPFISTVRATPVVSFSILVLLWVRTDFVPVIIVFLMVFPVIWANVYEGLRDMDYRYIEMAQVYRFSLWKKIRLIAIPLLMPYFIAACQTGIGMAWKSGVAAEVICMPELSIGRKLYETKIYLETPELFTWTVIAILFSVLLEKLLIFILKYISKKMGVHYENRK